MDAVRLGEGHWELDELVERVEAGETVEIMRGERLVAKVVPSGPVPAAKPEKADAARQEEWQALLRDIGEFTSTLKFDPRNSVEEMRKEARY